MLDNQALYLADGRAITIRFFTGCRHINIYSRIELDKIVVRGKKEICQNRKTSEAHDS